MSARVFVDTNVFVYLFDRDAPAKQRQARELVERDAPRIVISTQVLSEFYVTVTRKLGTPLSEKEAEAAAHDLAAFDMVDLDGPIVLRSIASARMHRMSLWDAMIVEAAQVGGCGTLLSEDLQHGRQFGGLRVEDPFR